MNRALVARVIAAAALIVSVVSGGSAQDGALRLEGLCEQGALLRGFTAPGARVRFQGRDVRVSDRGEFLVAIDPGSDETAQLVATLRGSRRISRELRIRARDFGVEHLSVEDDRDARARAEARLAAIRLRDTRTPYFRSGFEWPVHGPVTSGYGLRRTYHGVPGARHWGVDLAAPLGTPVRAPAAGIVALAEELPLMGRTIVIDHGHGLTSSLLHLSRVDVRTGELVERGDRIGAVGRSGNVTGVHLDWRMNLFGTPVDPQSVTP